MGKTFTAVVRLTRYREYLATVTITTLLGFLVTGSPFSASLLPRMLAVLFANICCVSFAFMINDIEDAVDDARDKLKVNRNPVSDGAISKFYAYTATFIVATISAIAFYFVGFLPFILGITTLIISFLYSLRLIRLKSIPVIDLVSHSLMLAGLQLLCAYYTLNPYLGFNNSWFLPFLFVVVISIRGQLFNQVRDFECDKKAGLKHTTSLIGITTAYYFMTGLLILAGVIFIFCLIKGIIPIGVFILMLILGFLILKGPLSKSKKYEGMEKTLHLQDPVLLIGLISLTIWTLTRFFNL